MLALDVEKVRSCIFQAFLTIRRAGAEVFGAGTTGVLVTPATDRRRICSDWLVEIDSSMSVKNMLPIVVLLEMISTHQNIVA